MENTAPLLSASLRSTPNRTTSMHIHLFDYSFRNCIVRTKEEQKKLLGQFIDAKMQANEMEKERRKTSKNPVRGSHTQSDVHNEKQLIVLIVA